MEAEHATDPSQHLVPRKRLKEALAKCGLDSSKQDDLDLFADACCGLSRRRNRPVPDGDYGSHLHVALGTKAPELSVPEHIAAGIDEAHAFRRPFMSPAPQPLAYTG